MSPDHFLRMLTVAVSLPSLALSTVTMAPSFSSSSVATLSFSAATSFSRAAICSLSLVGSAVGGEAGAGAGLVSGFFSSFGCGLVSGFFSSFGCGLVSGFFSSFGCGLASGFFSSFGAFGLGLLLVLGLRLGLGLLLVFGLRLGLGLLLVLGLWLFLSVSGVGCGDDCEHPSCHQEHDHRLGHPTAIKVISHGASAPGVVSAQAWLEGFVHSVVGLIEARLGSTSGSSTLYGCATGFRFSLNKMTSLTIRPPPQIRNCFL